MKATGIVRRIDDLGRIVIPQGNPQNAADQRSGPVGNIYGQGRGDHFKKIFANR